MNWVEEDWMVGLSGRVLQKVKELQVHLERLSRENRQKQLQLDNIHTSLEKQSGKYEEVRGDLQSLQRELLTAREEAKVAVTCNERLTQEIQSKQAQVFSFEGQLNASRTVNNKLTQEIKRLEVELEKLQNRSPLADTTSFSTPSWYITSPWEHNGSRQEETSAPREEAASRSNQNRRVKFVDTATPPLPRQQLKSTPHRHPSDQSDTFFTPVGAFPWDREDSKPTGRRRLQPSRQTPPPVVTKQDPPAQRNCGEENRTETDISELQSQISSLQEELTVKTNTVKSVQNEQMQSKKEFAAKELSLQRARDELSAAQTRMARDSEQALAAEQRLRQLQEELKCQQQNIESSRLQHQQRTKELEKQHQRDLAELQKEKQSLEKQHQQEVNKLNQELQHARKQHNAVQAHADKLLLKKQALDKDLDSLKEKLRWTEGKLKDNQKKEAQAQAKLMEIMREMEGVVEQSRKRERALEEEGKRLLEERADALRLLKELQEQKGVLVPHSQPVPLCSISCMPKSSFTLSSRTQTKKLLPNRAEDKREEDVGDSGKPQVTSWYPSHREPGEGIESEHITDFTPLNSKCSDKAEHEIKSNKKENRSRSEAVPCGVSETNSASHSAVGLLRRSSGDAEKPLDTVQSPAPQNVRFLLPSEDLKKENAILRSELRDVCEELRKRLEDLESQRQAEMEARTRLKQFSRKQANKAVEKEEKQKEWKAQLERERAETERLRKNIAALEAESKRGKEIKAKKERKKEGDEYNKEQEDRETEMRELNIQLKKQLAQVKAQLALEQEERRQAKQVTEGLRMKAGDLTAKVEQLQQIIKEDSHKEREKLLAADRSLTYLHMHDDEVNSNIACCDNEPTQLPTPEQHLLFCQSTIQLNMLMCRAAATDMIQVGRNSTDLGHATQSHVIEKSSKSTDFETSDLAKEVEHLKKKNAKEIERANQYQVKLEALQSQVTRQTQHLTTAFDSQSQHISDLLSELQEKESALLSKDEQLLKYKEKLGAHKSAMTEDQGGRNEETANVTAELLALREENQLLKQRIDLKVVGSKTTSTEDLEEKSQANYLQEQVTRQTQHLTTAFENQSQHLSDLLSEVQEKDRQLLQYKEELDALRAKKEEQEMKIKETVDEREKVTHQTQHLTTAFENQSQRLSELLSEVQAKESALLSKDEQLLKYKEELDALRVQKEEQKRKIKEIEREKVRLTEAMTKDQGSQDEKTANMTAELLTLREENQLIKQRIEDLEVESQANDLEEQVTRQTQHLTTAFENQSQHLSDLVSELQEKQSALLSKDEQLLKYKEERDALRAQKEEQERKIKEIEREKVRLTEAMTKDQGSQDEKTANMTAELVALREENQLIKQRIEDLEVESQANDLQEQVTRQTEHLTTAFENQSQHLSDLVSELQEKQSALRSKDEQLLKYKEELDALRVQKEEQERKIKEIEREKVRLTEAMTKDQGSQNEKTANMTAELLTLREENQLIKQRIEDLEGESQANNLQEQVTRQTEHLTTAFENQSQHLSDLVSELQEKQSALRSKDEQLLKYKEDRDALRAQKEEQEMKIKEMVDEREKVTRQTQHQTTAFENQSQHLSDLLSEVQEKNGQLLQYKEELDALRAKKEEQEMKIKEIEREKVELTEAMTEDQSSQNEETANMTAELVALREENQLLKQRIEDFTLSDIRNSQQKIVGSKTPSTEDLEEESQANYLQEQVTRQTQHLTTAFENQSQHIADLLSELQEKQSALLSKDEQLLKYKEDHDALRAQKEEQEMKIKEIEREKVRLTEAMIEDQGSQNEETANMTAELVALREENQLIKQRIEDLEEESQANDLQEQVTRQTQHLTTAFENQSQHLSDLLSEVEEKDRQLLQYKEVLDALRAKKEEQEMKIKEIEREKVKSTEAMIEDQSSQNEETANMIVELVILREENQLLKQTKVEERDLKIMDSKTTNTEVLEEESQVNYLEEKVEALQGKITALSEEMQQQNEELVLWRLSSQPAPTFDSDRQSGTQEQIGADDITTRRQENITVTREDDLLLSCTSNKLQGRMSLTRLQNDNLSDPNTLQRSMQDSLEESSLDNIDQESANLSQQSDASTSESPELDPTESVPIDLVAVQHFIAKKLEEEAARIDLISVSSQTEESSHPRSDPTVNVATQTREEDIYEEEEEELVEEELAESSLVSPVLFHEGAESDDRMLFASSFPIPSDPARLAERIRRSRTQVSAAFDDTEYEPYGLPEVVRKGFADIPPGPSCPYVVRRGLLGTAIVSGSEEDSENAEETD